MSAAKMRPLQVLLLGMLMAAGFALRFSAADHACISRWDEAYHALVAKNLIRHPLTPTLYDVHLFEGLARDWTSDGVWLHKPPLPLWLMAGAMAVGGDSELVFRLPSVILGTLSIALTFLLGIAFWGERGRGAALVACGLQAFNPLLIRLASGTIPTDHVDGSLVFFTQLALLQLVLAARSTGRALPSAAGAALGAAFLCKTWPAFAALAAAAPMLAKGPARQSSRRLALVAGGFGAVTLPWVAWSAWRWPELFAREWGYNTGGHLFAAAEGHSHPAWWYLSLLPVHCGGWAPAVWGLAALGLWAALRASYRDRDEGMRVLLLWALVPYAVFSAAGTKLYSYVAPAAPAVLLLFCAPLLGLRPGLPPRRRAAGAAAALLLALYAATLAPQRLRADYGTCPDYLSYDQDAFREAFRALRELPGRKAVFNLRDGKEIQAMFYADCPAYAGIPAPQRLRELDARGVKVFIALDESRAGWAEASSRLAAAGLLERAGVVLVPGRPRTPGRIPFEN